MRRRYVLLALAEAMRHRGSASRDEIARSATRFGLDKRTVDNEVSEFIQRDVLIEEDGFVRCKVPLFARWLQTVGPRQISTTYTEAEAVRIYLEEENKAAVKAQELTHLVRKWPPYKGRSLNTEDIRVWLDQFGKNTDQRLMFRVLQNLIFYSEDAIRSRMSVAHGIVTRGLVDRRTHKQVKRWPDIVVSYLDGPGKSGARFAKLYADENEMYYENVIERGQLRSVIEKRELTQSVVFIDDFVGTGTSATTYLRALVEECGDLLTSRNIPAFLIAVSGFETGKKTIDDYLATLTTDIRVHLCESLDSSHIAFGPNSMVFPDPNDRQRAKAIAEAKGRLICSPAPLGYGDSQAMVVFAHNCPNNTLPVLWERTKDWVPLFRRD